MNGLDLLSHPRFRLLATATKDCGLHYVLFDRDETDSYRIRMEAAETSTQHLSREGIMPALPVGSRWSAAVGWESYVVYPLEPNRVNPGLALVALEFVAPHASRGAYPVMGGAVVKQTDVGQVLRTVATEIGPRGARNVRASYGVVASDSISQQDHAPFVALILRSAATSYDAGLPLPVRTVLLTEDEILRRKTWRSLPPKWLACTVPAILNTFSWSAQKRLQLEHNVNLRQSYTSSEPQDGGAREMPRRQSPKDRIAVALKEAKAKGILPSGIEISRDIEAELDLMPPDELGLGEDLLVQGVRKAVERRGGTLFGCTVKWDAKELKVVGKTRDDSNGE